MGEQEQGSEQVAEAVDSAALEVVTRAEVDVRISTAKRFPRSITDFRRRALALATESEEVAATTYYRLERDGKKIEGPSIRMAEIVASSFGNFDQGSRIVSIDRANKVVVAQGYAWDLETNNRCVKEVSRRISRRDGKVYSDDMIIVTGNAASSLALRNAIFTVVPRALVEPVLREAKLCSLGKALTMDQRRERIINEFKALGASEAQTCALARRKGRIDLSADDLIALRGLLNAIAEEETSLAEALREATGVVEVETVAPKVTSEAVAAGDAKGKDQPKGAGHQEPAEKPGPAVGEKDAKGREVLERDERGPVVVAKKPKAETPEEVEAEKLFE